MSASASGPLPLPSLPWHRSHLLWNRLLPFVRTSGEAEIGLGSCAAPAGMVHPLPELPDDESDDGGCCWTEPDAITADASAPENSSVAATITARINFMQLPPLESPGPPRDD